MAKTIDENKLFIYNLLHIFKYVFSAEILPFLATFSFLYLLMPFSVLIFLFFKVIILMMAYKLAFDVLAGVSKGELYPKIQQNYLVSNGIAVKVFVIVIFIESVLFTMKKYGFDENQRFYFQAFATFVTPAIYMSLALTNSLITALNPLVIHKVIINSVQSYFIFVAFWLSNIYLLDKILEPFMVKYLNSFIGIVLYPFIQFSLLIVNFYILGYMLYQYRFKLSFITHNVVGDEINKVSKQNEKIENPIYSRIKRLIKDDEYESALEIIKELNQSGDETFELKELYDEAMRMHYFSENDRHLPEVKINRYLKKGHKNKAFSILIELLNKGLSFEPKQAEDIYELAKYAKQSNKPEIVKKLIKNFNLKYPDHPHIVNNYFLLVQVLYEDRNQRKKAKGILQALIKKNPDHPLSSEMQSWLNGMHLMNKKEQ